MPTYAGGVLCIILIRGEKRLSTSPCEEANESTARRRGRNREDVPVWVPSNIQVSLLLGGGGIIFKILPYEHLQMNLLNGLSPDRRFTRSCLYGNDLFPPLDQFKQVLKKIG